MPAQPYQGLMHIAERAFCAKLQHKESPVKDNPQRGKSGRNFGKRGGNYRTIIPLVVAFVGG